MTANPKFEANMNRRAAEACRNIQAQTGGDKSWFDWVPRFLDQIADHEEGHVETCSHSVGLTHPPCQCPQALTGKTAAHDD